MARNGDQRLCLRVPRCDCVLQLLAAEHADDAVDDELQCLGRRHCLNLQCFVLLRLGEISIPWADYRDCGVILRV